MVCMVCCPCSRRTGALLVGIFDLIIGAAGLSAVCFLLYIINQEIENLNNNNYTLDHQERFNVLTGLYWSIILSYVFPAAVTLCTGVFAVFTVAHDSDCCAITSILLTVILVFACAGILLILYLLGLDFAFLIPLIAGTFLHMCFTFLLLSFRANDLKARQTV